MVGLKKNLGGIENISILVFNEVSTNHKKGKTLTTSMMLTMVIASTFLETLPSIDDHPPFLYVLLLARLKRLTRITEIIIIT